MMEELIGGKRRRLKFKEQISWSLPKLLHPSDRKPVYAHRKEGDRKLTSSQGKDPRREVYNDPRRVLNNSEDEVKDTDLHQIFTLGFGPIRKQPVEYFDDDPPHHEDHTKLAVDGFEQIEVRSGGSGFINEYSTNISLPPVMGEDGELGNLDDDDDDVDYDGEESDGFGEEVTEDNFFTSFTRRRPSQVEVEEEKEHQEEKVVVVMETKKKKKKTRIITKKKIRCAPPRTEHEDEGCSTRMEWTRNDSSIFSPLSSALSSSSVLSASFQMELVSCSDISDDEMTMTTSTDSGLAESLHDNYWSGLRKSKYHQFGPSRDDDDENHPHRRHLPSNDLRYRLNLIRSQPRRKFVDDDHDVEEEEGEVVVERSRSSRSKKQKIDKSKKKKHRSHSRQRSHSHHRHKHRRNH